MSKRHQKTTKNTLIYRYRKRTIKVNEIRKQRLTMLSIMITMLPILITLEIQ